MGDNEFWSPPGGVHRVSGIITVSLSMLKGHLYRCSAADALKARGYRPLRSASQGGEALEHFALGPFMTALGRESPARSADEEGGLSRVPLHDGLRQWTAHAVKMYREAFTPDPAESLLRAVTPWVYRHRLPAPDHRDAREYRITAWGRCLRTADGSRRELRLPVNRLGTVEPHVGYVAAAALVLAEGTPGPSPEHVRVVEFALLDGSVRTLFDGTRAEAVELYRIHGSKALTALLDSREYRPGSACGGCAYLSVCPALRKEPGLLGVTAPGRPRRTWSVTNGRNYRACPARDHMRRLSLPAADEVERDSSAERGRAIHAYLAERHGHGSLRSCTVDVPFDWAPDGFHLSDEERELATLLLRRHASVCPLRYVRDRSGIRAEPRVVRHDPTANTVVIAAPDLLYRDEDSWVWRETKTSKSGYRKGGELLDLYPQLALAVPLIARGALGGSSTRARIELEILRPGGADLEIIDPFCPAVVSAAEKALSALVSEWHQDDHYLATPGRSCGRCEVARWCSARLTLPSPPDGSMA